MDNSVHHYERFLQQGRLLLGTSHLKKAEECLGRAIEIDPGRIEGHLAMTVCLRLQERYVDALKHSEQALSIHPESVEPHIQRGWIFCDTKEPDKAVAEAISALEKAPSSLPAMELMGRAWIILGDLNKAKAYALSVLKKNPNQIYALNLLSIILSDQGEIEQSYKVLASVLRLDPNNPCAQAVAGHNALKEGANDEAEAHFRASLRIFPGYSYARSGLLKAFYLRFFVIRWIGRIDENVLSLLVLVDLLLLFFVGFILRADWYLSFFTGTFIAPPDYSILKFLAVALIPTGLYLLNEASKSLMTFGYHFDAQLSVLVTAPAKVLSNNVVLLICVALTFLTIYQEYIVVSVILVYLALVAFTIWEFHAENRSSIM